MSHEALLVAGPPGQAEADRRRALVTAAAGRLPGAGTFRVLESDTYCVALAETDPVGGTFARLQELPGGAATLDIGTARSGVGAAHSEKVSGAGSEAGRIVVDLAPAGAATISADGAAYLPGYWAEIGASFLFSTHLASLVSLGLPADMDEQGLAEYLVALHPFGERTLLRNARILGAGAVVRWHLGSGTRVTTDPLFAPSDDALNDSEAIEEFGRVWRAVIGDIATRTTDERPLLGLSGGLDSRAIAVQAADLGFRPMSYTYGSTVTYEGRVAARLAADLELPHTMIPVSDTDVLRDAPDAFFLLDGAHSPAEMYELWFRNRLTNLTSTVINGLAGGPLWGDDKGLGVRGADQALDRQWHRYAGEARVIGRLLDPGFGTDLPTMVRSGLADSMSAWDMDARGDMVIFWKFANRQTRWGGMLINSLRRIGIRTEAPFLDARFLKFAARLSMDQRRNGNLYLRAHRELFSRAAGIPRSDDGNSPNGLDHVYWSGDSSFLSQLAGLTRTHPVSGARRALRRAQQVGAEWVSSRTPFDAPARAVEVRRSVFPADLWLRTRPAYSERLLAILEGAAANPIFSAPALESAIRSVQHGRPEVGALTLAKIATAHAWSVDYGDRAAARS
ncbi:asparagine synthase-related protein [Occultella glacieicola]|uniref:asparagine synthase-related protein n=1 Tax=Occultella glacieicola TaxID=2518684 RepID=UPI001404EA2A|nr:asparagine synthase-related protein [Occultella glacieicola]